MMNQLIATAEDPQTSLELIHKDLYIGVSNRPTVHKFDLDDVTAEEKDLYVETARENFDDISIVEDNGTEVLVVKSN